MPNRDALFVASCVALITTAMSFAIRGALIDPLGNQFGLSKEQIGLVVGTAFWGFTLAMIFGGPLCDVIGMKRLLGLAFVGHLIGIVGTIFAGGFWSLFLSTLAFGLANGFVEAACNPLIATLYPDQKIKRLSLFHAWFPGGIVIGGVVAYVVQSLNLGGKEHYWQIQIASDAFAVGDLRNFIFRQETSRQPNAWPAAFRCRKCSLRALRRFSCYSLFAC